MQMSQNTRVPVPGSPRVAVIGGGITGLATAFYLLRAGCAVTVYEAGPTLGGLSSSFDYGPFRWDRFYHCILSSDRDLLGLLEDVDLSDRVHWQKTEVGFYSRGALHTMTGPADLLRFPHLSLLDKLRFGLGTLYAARLVNGDGLEDVPLRDWIVRVFGKNLYREIWAPLLQCKLGAMQHQASAAFLWATLRRLSSTREQTARQEEKLGFVDGGYGEVLERLGSRVVGMGGDVRVGSPVTTMRSRDGEVRVESNGHTDVYDSAVITVPSRIASAMCPQLPQSYRDQLEQVQYLGIVCSVVLLRRSLSPYYVTNITDRSEFTGVIEMSRLIGTERTAGHTLVFLPKYTSADDRLFSLSNDEVWQIFERDLLRMHPTLTREDIVSHQVFRERYVQPVPTLGYSRTMPSMRTPLPGIFLANTSQIINDTLNNNAMTRIARQVCSMVLEGAPAVTAASAAAVPTPWSNTESWAESESVMAPSPVAAER